LVDNALGPDLSAMTVDNALNSRQTYAGTFKLVKLV
jgi:hypothetical protein